MDKDIVRYELAVFSYCSYLEFYIALASLFALYRMFICSAERRCRQELAREYCMEISVERSDLLKWYQDQGYVMGGQVSFPVPEIIRDEFDVKLQLLTKILP